MDNTVILYFVKASISLALFYTLYMLLLKKDTFFKIRRGYFLFAMIFSLSFPFLSIEIPIKGEMEAQLPTTYWLSQIEIGEITVQEVQQTSISIWTVLLAAIGLISVVLAIKFLIQLLSIVKLRVDSDSERMPSCRIVKLTDKRTTPFSFFHWIFVNSGMHKVEELDEIIAHEQVHVRQWHSVDVIMAEIMCICFWWNPFMWLLKNEMKINLEYLADQGVLQAGFNTKEYQYILLQTSKNTGIPIINNFNVSQLKKRITMMNKKRTSIGKATKYLLTIPLGAVLLLGNAVQASPDLINLKPDEDAIYNFVINGDEHTIQEKESQGENNNMATGISVQVIEESNVGSGISQTPQDKKPFNTVEVMPSFPGGHDAMNKYISENLKYPIKAQEKGVAGRVTIRFIVRENGEIDDVTVIRGIDEELDEEAIRVVKAMPKWTPGKQKGQAVPVYFTLPIFYKLKKSNPETVTPADEAKIKQITEAKSGVGNIFTEVEKKPSFPEGQTAMNKFIRDNLNYPVTAFEEKKQGRVTVRFVVRKNGEITDATVLRGFDSECEKEALRLVNSMPKWIPGKKDGKNVDVYFTLPLIFRIK